MHRRGLLRRVGAAGIGVGATAALAGCAGVGGDPDYDVGMVADGYRPAELTVSVGDTVVWENTSSRTHTVTAYEGGIPDDAEYFASGGYENEPTARAEWTSEFGGGLETGDRFSHAFEVPGRYDYVCLPHETGGMYATVFVEE
ncbi:plastocyanin/azurin family copper-binding protein [Halorubrum sp. AD140]|uniref:cupredoxin domain-containing protein n=1 Tax=Halorubrum sp. AD140 TaxID=3050073 RepID=UPI002ACCF189|nr:plastocyanin/azurin family copper-binding protein [Halorubrum sp. AD140]MDZ5811024.1 plastocyanin/azurin family copper-binding protein [Halorubrum sp. AD140]